MFDVKKIRRDFPLLGRTVHGKPLSYLDNANTTQRPKAVMDTLHHFDIAENSNIHRGVHYLSEQATQKFENVREKVAQFIHATQSSEIVFTKGATEAINLVAAGLRKKLKKGDEILISHMEHHSNIVPWQLLCEESGAQLVVAPILDNGILDLEALGSLLSEKTKVLAITQMSNALGTINPVKAIIQKARRVGSLTLVDGAQAIAHMPVDVTDLDCDFYVFSGHKLYAPMGVGVLYGKKAVLETLPPYQGGGDMILSVTFEKTTYNKAPYKFEAGTANVSGVIGLGAALDYLNHIDLVSACQHEAELLSYATESLLSIPGLKIIGSSPNKASVLSFILEGVHPHDIGSILDQEGVAIRTGHHCAQPVMERFKIAATARISLALYNNTQDIDAAVMGLKKVKKVLGL